MTDKIKLLKDGPLQWYNETNRPAVGEVCIFQPVKLYHPGVFKIDNRPLCKLHLVHGRVKVIHNHPNLVEVSFLSMLGKPLFRSKKKTDLVSPEFLMKIELTDEGKKLLEVA